MRIKLIFGLLVVIGLLVCVGLGNENDVTAYIEEEWSNVTHVDVGNYPDEWLCAEISNAYMEENKEWRGLGILKSWSTTGHAVNYRIEGDRLFVHDETWGLEYEFDDWENMTLVMYDWNEMIPVELGINIVNV